MAEAMPAGTAMGAVTLAVSDLAASERFYATTLGLERIGALRDVVALGAGGRELVRLLGRPDGRPAPGTTGLFHLALRFPRRAELAEARRRVRDTGWRLDGASDHDVSEALYLSDPDGHGIELYHDRPRARWTFTDGVLTMGTWPLDIASLLAEGAEPPPAAAPAGTDMGHVHLRVDDLAAAEAFYVETLGFTIMGRYPGALFVSAGGYHHHVGLNVWQSRGGPPPPPGALALVGYRIEVPSHDDVAAARGRLAAAGFSSEPVAGGIAARDPAGNSLALVSAAWS